MGIESLDGTPYVPDLSKPGGDKKVTGLDRAQSIKDKKKEEEEQKREKRKKMQEEAKKKGHIDITI